MRAGSTFLRSYFSHHPQIRWTRRAWYLQLGRSDYERRETYRRFFPPAEPGVRTIDLYESLCLGQYFIQPRGNEYLHQSGPDWSASWAMAHQGDLQSGPVGVDSAEIVRRIADCAPNAKVLVVLRNQIDWLRSMYVHYVSHLGRRRGFADFLNTREGKAAVDSAQYDRLLGELFSAFGRQRVHVMLLEELARREADCLADLCRFLNVNHHPLDPTLVNRNSQRGDAVRATHGRFWGAVSRLGLRKVRILGADDESLLRAFYAASNCRTAKLLGVCLAGYGYPL
jgi:hypothetical protein